MVTPRFAPDVGGVERHVSEVAQRLAALGCDITVLCTDRTGRAVPAEQRDGVNVRRVRAWPSERDYYFAPGIWREIRGRRCDLIHVQSYHTLVAPLAMLGALSRGIPFVLTFHGGGHSSRARHSLRGVQRQLLGPLIRRAERLVAVARFEVGLYGRELGIPAERFVVIPNGVTTPRGVPGPSAAAPAAGPVVASVGRLERYKGHHRALAALPHVLEVEPGARLWIVGTGPEEAALRQQAERLGVAHQVDFRSVPPEEAELMAQLLARTALVVQLSEFETHPLAALEAVAAGRRLLVTDTSGLRELADDGLARAIPADSSPPAIAAAVLEELRAPSRPAAVTVSTWDDCAASLLRLYREVVGTSSSGSGR